MGEDRYLGDRPRLSLRDRCVIVIDDGLATGSTMLAALHALRAKKPLELVCAVPVAPPASLELVRPLADEVLCLAAPDTFFAVGQFRLAPVEGHPVVVHTANEGHDVLDIIGRAQGRVAHAAAGRIGHLLVLQVIARPRKHLVVAAVVVVQVRDDDVPDGN